MSCPCHTLALHGGGQILNVASIAAFQPGPWMSTYYASKAYVLHFSEGLREELKTCGIKVSVLCPGPTRTAFFGTAQMDTAKLDRTQQLMSPEEVALYTVRALEKNKAIIIPGRRNRWIAFSPRLGPRWLTRKIAGAINKAIACADAEYITLHIHNGETAWILCSPRSSTRNTAKIIYEMIRLPSTILHRRRPCIFWSRKNLSAP